MTNKTKLSILISDRKLESFCKNTGDTRKLAYGFLGICQVGQLNRHICTNSSYHVVSTTLLELSFIFYTGHPNVDCNTQNPKVGRQREGNYLRDKTRDSKRAWISLQAN